MDGAFEEGGGVVDYNEAAIFQEGGEFQGWVRQEAA